MDLSPREKNIIFCSIALIVLVVSYFTYKDKKRQEPDAPMMLYAESGDFSGAQNVERQIEVPVETGTIFVDIGGAVQRPGLYELDAGSRVKDGIVAAGGIIGEADMSQVNQARKLSDEEKLYIPHRGEEVPQGEAGESEGAGPVSIQTASKEQLMRLPGIGEKTADKIIEHRNAHPFQQAEDLKEVPGIGEKTYESLKPYIK
ncbi:competence protein ComEA [Peptoniphilus ivorii]|uniref:ComEA family DNA-binding protein n=1 Tax=Aedoeadaptatus ivorii TaxID=54006 RepID=UPI0027867FD9|nr:ComEA family DNA-binding protein [Peptoniphilus ivorii]MDQ0507679.1 competence protein ComEA [Peptoniphilus ivorii]